MPESIKVQFVLVVALVINKHMKQQIRQSNKKDASLLLFSFCLAWRFFTNLETFHKIVSKQKP